MKGCFSDYDFRKKVFSFTSDDRTSLEKLIIGSKTCIRAKNREEKTVTIPFRVTRDAYLGTKTRWIYGTVLNAPDDEYHQIELKLHKNEPEKDIIEVFLQAPPVIINKLR